MVKNKQSLEQNIQFVQKTLLPAVFAILIFILTTPAAAQTAINSTSIKTDDAKSDTAKKKFSVSGTISTSSDLYKSSDPSHQSSTDYSVTPSYILTKDLKLSSSLGLSQDNSAENKTSIANTPIRLSHSPIKLTKGLSLVPSTSITLPTNEDDRDQNTFQTQLAVGGVLIAPLKIGSKTLNNSYSLTAINKVHEFNRNSDNIENVEKILSQSISTSLDISEAISVSASFGYTMAWTYQNTFKSTYSNSQSLGLALSKSINLDLSHSIRGNALNPNGRDRNIKLFDERASTISASITLVN